MKNKCLVALVKKGNGGTSSTLYVRKVKSAYQKSPKGEQTLHKNKKTFYL